MPGGHASHKSTSAKPNTNANGVIDTSLGVADDPDSLVTEVFKPARDGEEMQSNPLATQRPGEESESSNNEDRSSLA